MVFQMPYSKIACYHCGYWMKQHPESNSCGLSSNMVGAIQKAFRLDHRKCKPSDEGRETWIYLHREWDDWMRENPKEREEWEKDYSRVWAPTDWATAYGEWMSRKSTDEF